ncbi:MAG: aldo/keto reductase [Oscillospiraceae bacterium]|nr:aldo/keto reductase [Oscillospiraceae bacterium]
MKQIKWGSSEKMVPAVAMGCMRLTSLTVPETAAYLEKAVSLGVTFFDHADIYGGGECETLFGKALAQTALDREAIWIQSKCSIVPGVMYDLSKEHILNSVDKILKRLDTPYLDSLLLHRPDALVEPEEVAEAFDALYTSGKVRHFGVSNHTPGQIMLLEQWLDQPIEANQLQFGLGHTGMIRSGMECNMESDGAVHRDGEVLPFCRLNNITIQTWSPFQYGMFAGTFLDNPKFPELNLCLEKIADAYGVEKTTIAAAWILRHPANMQMIAGTMNAARLEAICKAAQIRLTREQWYQLYLAAGNDLP